MLPLFDVDVHARKYFVNPVRHRKRMTHQHVVSADGVNMEVEAELVRLPLWRVERFFQPVDLFLLARNRFIIPLLVPSLLLFDNSLDSVNFTLSVFVLALFCKARLLF